MSKAVVPWKYYSFFNECNELKPNSFDNMVAMVVNVILQFHNAFSQT